MEDTRFRSQLGFLLEIDRLKGILRRTYRLDGTHRENDAEHSWHLAMYALVLAEYAPTPVDVGRVIAMVLVHDLVEIDAGDTYLYDVAAQATKAEREAQAADRIFGMLPSDQGVTLRRYWEEFEARTTPEARFAAAIDRLQPLMHNIHTQGRAWQEHGITLDQVLKANAHVASATPDLWPAVVAMLEHAVEAGHLGPARSDNRRSPSR